MEVTYLSSDVRLSKTFKEIAPGNYQQTSYPHVANFTSITKSIDTLKSFYLLTEAAANEGCCLVKGNLDKELLNESRAGHTDPDALTEWVCLDVDFQVTEFTPAEFLDALSLEFNNVSFLFQKSASHGIGYHEGWRGHFFILLDEPQRPSILKQWLIHLNHQTSMLEKHIELSASGGALRYPLDITTCQNDKLLYIAPPTCVGFTDPVDERFELVVRGKERVTLDLKEVSEASNKHAVQNHVQELRKAEGRPHKKIKTKTDQGVEVMTNPDAVEVTGTKEARDFVYLNLNGGDSWAYFFPVNNPYILYNFKGEPCLYMRDVDLDLFNEYAMHDTSEVPANAKAFGFLWANDDCYYRGFADATTRELVWLKPTGSKSKLRDFLVGNGVNPASGWAVPEWTMDFDPSTEGYADFTTQTINTYKKTEYLKAARKTSGGIPPTIDKVLNSVCVHTEIKEHFINWLACILQTRMKTNTAWIFQGVQGTGKGVLFTRVLSPILGTAYCHEMTMDRLDDDYNAYLAENILLFIDEAKIGDSRNGDRLLNRIKNLVTEPEQHIRGMRKNAVMRKNYSNIILASNYDEIIPIEVSDRRFNVAPRQESPIQLEYEDVERIKQELQAFTDYLYSYEANTATARKVMLNEARAKLIKLSETTVDSFFLAIRNGDLAYFTQYLDNGMISDMEGVRYHDFSLVVKRWMGSANKEINVSRNELRTVYQFLQNVSISTTKFSRMVAKYNIDIVPVRVDGEVTRGVRGHVWNLSDEERDMHTQDIKPGTVVRIRK